MKKRVNQLFACLATTGLIAASVAVAAEQNVASAIKARHDHYHELGDAFKTLRDQLRAVAPDWAQIAPAAQAVKQASVDQAKWFARGTGPESGLKTRAKAEIWSDPAAFKAAQQRFAQEAPKLLALAQTRDAQGLGTQFKVVGKSCAECHDKFRAPEDEH